MLRHCQNLKENFQRKYARSFERSPFFVKCSPSLWHENQWHWIPDTDSLASLDIIPYCNNESNTRLSGSVSHLKDMIWAQNKWCANWEDDFYAKYKYLRPYQTVRMRSLIWAFCVAWHIYNFHCIQLAKTLIRLFWCPSRPWSLLFDVAYGPFPHIVQQLNRQIVYRCAKCAELNNPEHSHLHL